MNLVRAQDVPLVGRPDDAILAWAAEAGRVLLTHDASTMTAAAYTRIEALRTMPGVIVIPQWMGVGAAIEDLVLVAECSVLLDWADQVRFLPLDG